MNETIPVKFLSDVNLGLRSKQVAAKILTDPIQQKWFPKSPRTGYLYCPLPKDCKAFKHLLLIYNLFEIWIRVDVNEIRLGHSGEYVLKLLVRVTLEFTYLFGEKAQIELLLQYHRREYELYDIFKNCCEIIRIEIEGVM